MRATESRVLWHMGAHGPITAAALAARLRVEPARLRAVLERLGRRGYVRPDRYGVPDLTATGREALVKLVKRAHGNAGPVRPGSPAATRVRWLATGWARSVNSPRA
jgi:hypothetical protein